MSNPAEFADTEEKIWFINALVTVRRSYEEGPDGVAILEFQVPYGDSPPTHVHLNQDEIFHVFEGRMRFRVGDREFTLEAGQTAVAPKGVPHSFRVESENGARGLNITIGPDFEEFVRAVGRPAEADRLPPRSEPTPAHIVRLKMLAEEHGAEIVGPPLQ